MLRVGSLFTGIGGFDLGLERAGMRVVWQCEQDAYCQRILARHWPSVPCYPDVRALVGDSDSASTHAQPTSSGSRRSTGESTGGPVVPVPVPHVDVLCGGFPCQDLSYAGRGAGINGARSGLWAEYARLIRELRPRYVIVENVPALLARGMGRVLGDLAACGYDAEWDCIPASAVGAPHRRDRVWIVAYPNGAGREARVGDRLGALTTTASGQSACPRGAVADTDGSRLEGHRAEHELRPDRVQIGAAGRRNGEGEMAYAAGEGRRSARTTRPSDPRITGPLRQPARSDWWAAEPDVGRVAHGIPHRVDRLRALGNALIPQIAEWIGQRIIEHEQTR